LALSCVGTSGIWAGERDVFRIPAIRLEPLPGDKVSFLVGDRERVGWHFGPGAPRPFFYPFNGPSGHSLTRMGHPGAANHDHHRSVWFGHRDVAGADFWSEGTGNRVMQKEWLCYQDGDEEAILAVRLGWRRADGTELLDQELVAALRPLEDGETWLKMQATFRPGGGLHEVILGKTNFGFLAVRVVKSLSEYFGGGELTNSRGFRREAALFGQEAEWVDSSGPVAHGGGTEGIAYFDHPANPNHPAKWHVREDGWMGASFCLENEHVVTAERPLRLRYLLHAHAGPVRPERARRLWEEFSALPEWEAVERKEKHGQWNVVRRPSPPSPPGAVP